jgi:ribonuclease HI
LVDPKKNKILIACRLEFECNNNVVEYEALIQGLRKEIDLGVKNMKVFGDSKIIVKKVRNSIHCVSNKLTRYQQEVWDLLSSF